ncbi:D-alanine--D-alanine ligase [Candidatus Curculioniphilus buchneri]|uniref:D-alanine--D-alanine ligase n=1 Tax=Candidatus Curculioniphilus buchneri TaxID=690594 RepID=UPI00376F2F65
MVKTRVGVLFGGRSVEHEISLQSSKNIIHAINKEKFDIILLGIDKQGVWHIFNKNSYLLNSDHLTLVSLKKSMKDLAILPGFFNNSLVQLNCPDTIPLPIDIIFPIVHGPFGEDGSLQGLLRMTNIPYVGSSVLGSAISMDKDITKRLLRDAGLAVTPSFTLTRSQYNNSGMCFDKITSALGLPLFIKPANQGSSVGVSKIINRDSFEQGLALAFNFDHKVLVEAAIIGRELECAVLGSDELQTSVCGEIILNNNFYSYQNKYINTHDTHIVIPANISRTVSENIRSVARRAFRALHCSCMARVDVFLTVDEKILVNEINTLPGFTNVSMYPRLWQASGLSCTDLITRLIELALTCHRQDQYLTNSLTL